MVKDPPFKQEMEENVGSIPRLGRSPGEGNEIHSIIAWKIPWTEKPGRLQAVELQKRGIRLND